MKALQRPGRTAAVVGAVVAVGATALMGFAGIASASPTPGTCTENVNVRAEPSIDSPIVALCEAGTAVQTGITSNGFVQITDLGGWASAEYISVDRTEPASTGPAPSPATTPSTAPSTAPSTGSTPANDDETATSSDDELSDSPSATEPGATEPGTVGSGTADEQPGRDTITPQGSDSPSSSGPADDMPDEETEETDAGGFGGLL